MCRRSSCGFYFLFLCLYVCFFIWIAYRYHTMRLLRCQHQTYHCSNFWHWEIHTCLMSYSWNAMRRKEVLTHWSSVPSSGALWEGGRISVQYLQWPFPLTGQGPMGKNWRRQTMNNRVQGWAMVPAQYVPLQNVDYRRLGGHSKDQGTSASLKSTPGAPVQKTMQTHNHVFLATLIILNRDYIHLAF